MSHFFRLTTVAVLMTGMAVAQTASTGTNTAAKRRAARKSKRPTVTQQLERMQKALDSQNVQIQVLQQQVQDRNQAIQQLQTQVQQAQSTAQQAQQSAESASQANATTSASVATMQHDVTDLKTVSTNAVEGLQDSQKRISSLESPLAMHYKGITITPGGFLAAETAWRQRGTASDVNTPFNSIPFTGADAARLSEFYGSGRQSRVSMLAEGKVGSSKFTGYVEADFLSAGLTSNNNQSNSYTLRQRQAWGQAALGSGWTFTGGQMWSLVTETKKGVDNRSEALPMTIDAQYQVGFSWARQYGFRVSKNFGNKMWLAFSVENPQTIFSSRGQSNNFILGNVGTGGGLYSTIATYTFNYTPDFVVKAAFEPGFGHYELFGVIRNFRDRVYPNATGSTPSAAGAYNYTTTGGGIGANARWSVYQKHIDVGIHFLGGNGIGRYGTSTLPDATVRPDGTLALIRNYQSMATIEWHSSHWDWYANVGDEYSAKHYYRAASGTLVGYGTPGAAYGCGTELVPAATTAYPPTSSGYDPASPGNCSMDTKQLIEGTIGFWYKPYNGPKGRIQIGPQYSYVYRQAWHGLDATKTTSITPNAIDNMWFTSFRYYLP